MTFAPDTAASYGVVDEIARRVCLNSGRYWPSDRTTSLATRASQPSSATRPDFGRLAPAPRRVEAETGR